MGIAVGVFNRKRGVGDAELADHGAAAESGESQGGGLDHIIVQHLEDPLDGVDGGDVVVGGGGGVVVVALALVEDEGVGGAVAAAEFVLSGRDE